jgi:putative flippase GtrA
MGLVYENWLHAPRPLRFLISGGLGNFAFVQLDRLLLDRVGSVPVAFTAAYIVSIALQYFLHAFLVFGEPFTVTGLVGCYAAYTSSIALSFVVSALFDYLFSGFPHVVIWLANMTVLSIYNYYVVSAAMDTKVEKKHGARSQARR